MAQKRAKTLLLAGYRFLPHTFHLELWWLLLVVATQRTDQSFRFTYLCRVRLAIAADGDRQKSTTQSCLSGEGGIGQLPSKYSSLAGFSSPFQLAL